VNLATALQLYKNKEYEQALTTLKKYTKASPHYKDILVVRALSYHKLQQTPIALQTLDSLTSYAPNISKWYKGLIYLENNELEKAALYIQLPTKPNQEIKLK
jgi:tetratricopeptide (TPR) repeat protein